MRVSEARARDYGEVLTPAWMVQRMLNPLSDTVLHGRVLDLCSGPGVFLIEIFTRRLAAIDPADSGAMLHSLGELYGFELLAESVQQSRQALLNVLAEHLASQPETVRSVVLAQGALILQRNLMQVDVLRPDSIEVSIWDADLNYGVQNLAPGFFNLIVSNPPYQRNISSLGIRNQSKSTPLYHLFYDYARELQPTHMLFIMPAKWYTGGWGLDAWRQSVLRERHVRLLEDYRDSNHIFPGTEVNGGICWLWRDAGYEGDATITRYDREGKLISATTRPLLEDGSNFFIRNELAISILNKVGSFHLPPERQFTHQILPTTPFGFPSNFKDYQVARGAAHDVSLYYIKKHEYWVGMDQVRMNRKQVDRWKIFLSLSYNQHSPQIIGQPKIAAPHSVCTHSYLAVTGFEDETQAKNCVTYMKTKFFRFLAHQLKISPIATRQVYRLIPRQDWSKTWTDTELYAMYRLDEAEIVLIEATITDML